MTRADRLELVRQLRDEGMSQRAIAKRLKVSKDTVRRDFERLDAGSEPGDEPPGCPDDEDAPQVSDGDRPGRGADGAPGDAPPGEPAGEPVAHLPRREPGGRLVIDLARRPGLRRDLAVLADVDVSAQDLVERAVHILAVGYQEGLAVGDVLPGQPWSVTRLSVAARGLPGRRVPAVRATTPAAPAGGG